MSWLTYYFAISKGEVRLALNDGVTPNILVSFAHYNSSDKRLAGLLELVETVKARGGKVMLYSGAFTNMAKPGTVKLEQYVEFLQSSRKSFDEYVMLDDMGSRITTLKNFVIMLKAGLRPLFVDHLKYGDDEQVGHIERKEGKVCLSGWGNATSAGVAASTKSVGGSGLGEKMASKVKRLREVKTKTHLLAAGSLRRFLPHLDVVDSVDSASATRAVSYGRVMHLSHLDIGGRQVPILQASPHPEARNADGKVKAEIAGKLRDFIKARPEETNDHCYRLFCIREIGSYVKALNKFTPQELMGLHQKHTEGVQKSYLDPDTSYSVFLDGDWEFPLEVTSPVEKATAEIGLDGDEVFVSDDNGNLVKVTATPVSSVALKSDKLSKQVPAQAASTDEKREAQQQRAKEFGIEALEGKGERLSFPAGWPTDLKLYGDPVNLGYPLDPPARARNARARFKQFADQAYEQEQSKRIIHTRIVTRLLELEASPSFDESDKLDALLPADLKAKLTKTEKRDDSELELKLLPILKVETAKQDKQIVFGVVLEPSEVDAQGDTIDAEEIEQAAHAWLGKYQNSGLMHRRMINGKVEIFESYLAPTNLTIGGQKVKKGTWLLMIHVKDAELWKRIKSGELTGLSMGGYARRVKPT